MVSQAAAAGDASAALPAEAMRCAGPVAVAGVREGILWLLDARGQASTSYSGCKTWKKCHKFIYPCAVLFEMQRCCCAWSLHPHHPFPVAPGRTWAGMHPTSVPHNMRSWRNFNCPSVLLRM